MRLSGVCAPAAEGGERAGGHGRADGRTDGCWLVAEIPLPFSPESVCVHLKTVDMFACCSGS